jgi:hypothetical protein
MSRALALVAGATAALGLAACQTTQQRSAVLRAEGKGLAAAPTAIAAGAVNPAVRVGRTAVLHDANGTAAVVELRSSGSAAQRDVPIFIDVRDVKGASMYKNNLRGLQPALQTMALLRPGKRAWWVNDQVLGAGPARSVAVHVGTARTAPVAKLPRVTLRHVHFGSDTSGPYVTGTVVNHSTAVQLSMPVFAVALRGSRVVAAGRAIVPKLPVGVPKHPVTFRIYFIGAPPRGAQIQVTVAPTVLP